MPTQINRWNILAILCLFNFAITLTYQSIPPILSLIIEDLQISHTQAGLIMSAYVLPSVILTIPLSLYAERLGIKRIGMIGMCLIILGSVLVASGKTLTLLLLGRLVMGIGSIVLPIVGTQCIARVFMHDRLGLALGIYSIAMPLSTIVPFFTFGGAGILWGWRATVWITIAVVLLVTILFYIYFKMPTEERGTGAKAEAIAFNAMVKIGKIPWLLATCWGIYLIGHISLLTFLPDFMYQSGQDLRIAGLISGIIMLWGAILGPFTGYLLDRAKYKEIFLIISNATGAVLVFLLPHGLCFIIFAVMLLGIFTTPMVPAVNAIVPFVVKREMLALSYSINFTLASIGMFVGPYLTGAIRDATGSYNASFVMIAVVFVIAAMIGLWLLLFSMKRRKAA